MAAYVVLSVPVTWPLLRDLSTKLGGNELDPWQTLWGFWWLRHAHEFGDGIMFTRMLWWPDGVPLWFQTWDLPSALVASTLWDTLPGITLYNLILFATFPLAGFACYLLCREQTGGVLGPFLAGSLYTFSTYHFAHATANLHLASMQWSPLFFLGLIKWQRGRDFVWPSVAGFALGAATLASSYHFVFCMIGGVVMVGDEFLEHGRQRWSRRRLAQASAFFVVFAACAGWLLIGMARAYFGESFEGQHQPLFFSADLQSFVLPNPVNVTAKRLVAWQSWRALDWECGSYIGLMAMGLAACGATMYRVARPFACVAILGAILSLGPRLHIGGVQYDGFTLPYAWVERVVPVLAFSGAPMRFSWLTTFGVAVAAGTVLGGWCQRSWTGAMVAVAVTVLALIEIWPRPMMMTALPQPAMFQQWGSDARNWAVLDASFWSQALLHQTLHRHPIVAGYVTRTPERLLTESRANPVLAVLFRPPVGAAATPRLAISPIEARRFLQGLRIRFVILDAARCSIAREMGLVERYQGDGLCVFENREWAVGVEPARVETR
jgi:hypothetical protein